MKVGDYIRTDEGIRKIEEIDRQYVITDFSFNEYSSNLNDRKSLENNIIKSSSNIIDLIETGDYVNGCYVLREHYTYMGEHFIELDTNNSWEWGIGNMPTKYIKSIVTKEQFESIEYKIGE